MAGFSPTAGPLILASAPTPRSSHIFIAESFALVEGSPDFSTASSVSTLHDILLGPCWSPVSHSRGRFRMSTPTPQCCSPIWPFSVSPSTLKGTVATFSVTAVAAGSAVPVTLDALSRSLRLDAASLLVFSTACKQIHCVHSGYYYCLSNFACMSLLTPSIICKCTTLQRAAASTSYCFRITQWTKVEHGNRDIFESGVKSQKRSTHLVLEQCLLVQCLLVLFLPGIVLGRCCSAELCRCAVVGWPWRCRSNYPHSQSLWNSARNH